MRASREDGALAPQGGCGRGRRGLGERAEHPSPLTWPRSALRATGLARGGPAAPPSVVPRVVSASARWKLRATGRAPQGVSTRSFPTWLGRSGPGSLLQAGPPTPRPQSWGWLSTEGFEVEHCPPPALSLNGQPSPVVSHQPVHLPFNLPATLFFSW